MSLVLSCDLAIQTLLLHITASENDSAHGGFSSELTRPESWRRCSAMVLVIPFSHSTADALK